MPSSLKGYVEAAAPLQACLLRVARAARPAAKKAAACIVLAGAELRLAALAGSRRLLRAAMKLAHPRPGRQMRLLLLGAPNGFCAALAAQAPHECLDLSLAEQRHECSAMASLHD